MRYYHQTAQLLEEIGEVVEQCEDAKLHRVRAEKGKESGIVAVRLGKEARKRREWGAEANGEDEGTLRVMGVFGEHGREFVTSEVVLRIVEEVCGRKKAEEGKWKELLERTEFVLVPVVSEDSRIISEGGKWCGRLNANGVDVNRNYKWYWGKTDDTSFVKEEKPGSKPFSEMESRAVRTLVKVFKPHVYISVHSGGRALVMPWDYGGGRAFERGSLMEKLLERLQEVHCPDCSIGTVRELFQYNAFGTGVDYVHGIERVPLAFTMEIFGDDPEDNNDCFASFNPITGATYEEVVGNWAKAFSTIAKLLHENGFRGLHQRDRLGWARSLGLSSWMTAEIGQIEDFIIETSHIQRIPFREVAWTEYVMLCLVLIAFLIIIVQVKKSILVRERRFGRGALAQYNESLGKYA